MLQQALAGQLRSFQKRRLESRMSVRDLVPPTHDAFTSEREHFSQLIDQLELDLDRVSTAIQQFDTLQRTESLLSERIQTIRKEVETYLTEIEDELAHFKNEHDEMHSRLSNLNQEIIELRESLTSPATGGTEFVLPLARESIDEWDLREVETELTSIAQYKRRGLVSDNSEEIVEYLKSCYQYSRSWPDEISQHDVSESMSTSHDKTVIIYNQANKPIIEKFMNSITGADEYYTSSGEVYSYTDDPFKIDIVSISYGSLPESLVGFQRLREMAHNGTFEALSGPYRDFRRALTFPEWYEEEIKDAFK
jgi:hypothetical protein